MGATIIMVLLIAFMVLMVIVLVLLSNPPNQWVEKLGGRKKPDPRK